MTEFLKGLKANYTMSAILSIIMGLVLLIWPGTTTQIVCTMLGIVLLSYGIIQIVMFLWTREKTVFSQGILLLGIIFAVIGAWIILKPEMIIMAVPVIVGILIIIHGLHNIIQAVDLKREGYEKWWLALLFGVLTVLFGALLIYNPFGAVEVVVRMIGIFMIYDGVSDIWIISRLSKIRKIKEKIVDAEFIDVEDIP
ncbi:MAG: HdeD family acid-resistance protein [Suilimivivens sp.]|nr:DUF308 domain-containing protein [Lachnospiraceae bacterium]